MIRKCLILLSYVAALATGYWLGVSPAWADEGDDMYERTSRMSTSALEACAARSDACRMQLGQAYLYGAKTADGEIRVDTNSAGGLLGAITRYPYARYLEAKRVLWEEKGDRTDGDYLRGASLLQSSCMEGVLKACIRSANVYAGRYDAFGYFKAHPDLKAASIALQNGIRLLNARLRTLADRTDDASRYERDSDESDRNDYQKMLGRVLIESNDRKGVALLEGILLNEREFDGDVLGELYETGHLVPRDLVKAYMYYDLGGDAREEDKQRMATSMTPGQINTALKRSWLWQEQHRSYRPGYRNGEDFPIQAHINDNE